MKFVIKIRESKVFMQIFPVILLGVLCALFGLITKGQFLSSYNLISVLNQCLILGTIATGAGFIFGTGNVNLAMGGTAALSAVVGGCLYLATDSLVMAFVGCVLGGVLLSYCAIPLGNLTKMTVLTITTVMMMLYPAIQSWVLGANTISIPYTLCSSLQKIQLPLIIFIIFMVICVLVFYLTPVGREIRFLGDNEECAQLTGMSKTKIYSIAFIIGGIACGLGAFSTIVRTGNVSTTTLSSGNMNVVLSIVIGGMPIFGGYKTQPYSGFLGAVVLTVLDSGLLMAGVDSSVLQAIKGIIFMVFVVISWERPQGLATKGA